MTSKYLNLILFGACVVMLPVKSFAGAINVLHAISLLADVKTLTTGFTLDQTAADTFCSVTVLGITTKDDPPVDTGIFSAGSQCDLTVGAASAKANAEATIGNWEPFSSSGTVLTAKPTKATAALINNNPASAVAAATAAINGRVTSKKDIQPPPALAPAPQETASILFTMEFLDVLAGIGVEGETVTFEYGIDFSDGSDFSDITFIKGQIGGSGNNVLFPFIEETDIGLASQLTNQFLNAFTPDAEGIIDVSHFLVGEGIFSPQSDGAVGFEYTTTLDEEYTISGNLTSIDVASVPEPSTYILFLLGIGGLVAFKRTKDTSKTVS